MVRFVWLLLLAAGSLLAQGTATLSGTVTDPSGAVIPGAPVKITNVGTGWNRTVNSLSDGRYYVSPLTVGAYQIDVEVKGFSKLTRTGIVLNADENARVDLKLELGETSRSITVSADAALVDTSKSMQVTLVDSARMQDLPLNGRDAASLQLLQPGVVRHNYNNDAETPPVSINGARGSQSNYTLDGGMAMDDLNQTSTVMPNPDALEEFSIVQFANSAEFGRGAGGQVNVITKSGTNTWHGSLFEFLRNDKLNARSFFAPSRAVYRKNQFGGTVGGPVRKDRTFFFFSYQGTRQNIASTTTVSRIPSDIERQGDFSQSPRIPNDPLNGQPFPNGLVPASRFDPASVKFIDMFMPEGPQPVAAPYYYNSPTSDNSNEYMGRGDHIFSSRDRLSGHLFWNNRNNLTVQGGSLPGFSKAGGYFTRNLSLNETHQFSANLVNDFRYTLGHRNQAGWPIKDVSLATLGVQIYYPEDTLGYKPSLYLQTGDFVVRDQRPSIEKADIHQFSDSVMYVRGKHIMKFGFDARRIHGSVAQNPFYSGYFGFGSNFTGVNFGDFLLGLPDYFRQGTTTMMRGRGTEYSLFAQDDFRLSRTVTLNLGVRWDPFLPPYDVAKHYSYYRAGRQSRIYTNAPPGLLFAGDPDVPNGVYNSDWNNVAPRIGFAWDVTGNGKTSIRGGYGIFYTATTSFQAGVVTSGQPHVLNVIVNAPGSFVDPWGASGVANPFPYTPATEGGGAYPFTYPISVNLFEENFRTGYLQQWNFIVERQLWADTLFRAAYVGSKGTKLWWDGDANPAVYIPGQSTVANTNSRRPLAPYFAGLNMSRSLGTSNYNALQVTARRRFSRGLTFDSSYTWSKSIDLNSGDRTGSGFPYPYCPDCNRGRSDWDRSHVFVASWVWELPFLKSRSGLAGNLLGGWRFSGIATAMSGGVFGVGPGSQTSLSGTGGERADLIGDPHLEGGGTRARWFNTAAFAVPASGSWGNSGKNILEGPGLYNFDFALNKDFRIRESHALNVRFEAFNALNHANFGNPNGTMSSSNFGRILSASSGRVGQVALKYVF